MDGKFVAYYRVSTQRQGQSGLGLEAQKESVTRFLNGGNWELIAEFTEVETGKGKDALDKRPQLRAAMTFAKKNGAKLVIAKLDRLARNVHFISGLMESKVPFVCADMPEANELTIHMLAVFAQHEAKRISERTKAALEAAKARGVKLGKPENLQKGCAENREKALEFASKVKPIIETLKAEGNSQRKMVSRLNDMGIKTQEGKEWHLRTLQRVLERLDEA